MFHLAFFPVFLYATINIWVSSRFLVAARGTINRDENFVWHYPPVFLYAIVNIIGSEFPFFGCSLCDENFVWHDAFDNDATCANFCTVADCNVAKDF